MHVTSATLAAIITRDNDIQNLLFTANHFYGNWQLMTTVMTAQGNDDLKDNTLDHRELCPAQR